MQVRLQHTVVAMVLLLSLQGIVGSGVSAKGGPDPATQIYDENGNRLCAGETVRAYVEVRGPFNSRTEGAVFCGLEIPGSRCTAVATLLIPGPREEPLYFFGWSFCPPVAAVPPVPPVFPPLRCPSWPLDPGAVPWSNCQG